MNRKTLRLFTVVAVVVTAGLAACQKNEAKATETAAPKATYGKEWGSGPYSDWQPITPPSKAGK